ncbi:TetR-like C-terminal domain-containing protein [Streptomyces sp. 900116325]
MDAFRAAFLTERRTSCATLIQRGIACGDLPGDTDIELFMDALAGAIFYRQLVTGLPIDDELPDRLLRVLGLRPGSTWTPVCPPAASPEPPRTP